MSEQGWRTFLSADGLDDWVVLHGGATAVFRVRASESQTGHPATLTTTTTTASGEHSRWGTNSLTGAAGLLRALVDG